MFSGISGVPDGCSSNMLLEVAKRKRRRRQNRVNQQAWRQRLRIRKELGLVAESQRQDPEPDIGINPTGVIRFPVLDLNKLAQLVEEKHRFDEKRAGCQLPRPDICQLLALYESVAYQSYVGAPNADHRLTLVKLNVFRAFVSITAIFEYTREWIADDDALSCVNLYGPDRTQQLGSLPASLQPTSLQKSQPHHPWLDLFPFPQ